MRRSFTNVGCLAVMVVLLAAATLVATGCASTGKVSKDFPETVEMVVQTAPSEPDHIDYIDVNPWQIEPGGSATVSLKATEGRKAMAYLKGMDGKAAGVVVPVELTPGADGLYTGTITAGKNLPPGKYRLEAVIEGGPTGQPTKLVSSRALTLLAPPPPVDPCMVAATGFKVPTIHFAFDKYDLDEASTAYLLEVAAKLRELGPRVKTFTVHGYCDERGTTEYNLALGSRRAIAIREFLGSQAGLSGLNAETISHGEEDPIVPNAKTEEEHAMNRRAVFEMSCRPR